MIHLYNLLIYLYSFLIHLASLRNDKAKLWVRGRKNILDRIKESLTDHEARIWVHCASLGEFEQGRPVIEEIRSRFPDHKIFLTFFSPSGYEIRKDYQGADYIFYLPADTIRNSRRFIRLVQPVLAVFIKYEFWFNYFRFLKKEKIPVLMVSAIFRENQYFFRWYGSWAREMLRSVSHFFVQNQASVELLKKAGFDNVTLSGDTRFDRVLKIADSARPDPLVEKFCGSDKIFLAGSSWPKDEELIIEYLKTRPQGVKFIIAAHETDSAHIEEIENKLSNFNTIRYSALNEGNAEDSLVLLIDGIGYLSRLYRYATIAYIGGGFGKGIHNILEAVTFGKPVIFGPNFHKFQEAHDLISKGVAFSVRDAGSLINISGRLLNDPVILEKIAVEAKDYILSHSGATAKISAYIGQHLNS